MKKFYYLIAAIIISTGVSAQDIINFAFANEMPFGAYAYGNEEGLTFTADHMEIKWNQAEVGIQTFYTDVTDHIEFDLDFTTPDRWTYFLLMNIRNGAGDTIAQVLPQCKAGGKLVLSTVPKSGSAPELLAQDTVEVSGIAKNVDVKLGIKVDVANKVVYASRGEEYSYTDEVSTPLFADPDGKIIFEFIAKFIAQQDIAWMRNISVTGTGTPAEKWEIEESGTGVNSLVNGNNFVRIPSSYSLSGMTGLAPEVQENVLNCRYNIYDLSGRMVYSSDDITSGCDFLPSKGLYLMTVQGETVNGQVFNKTGKVLVVE